MNTVTTMPRGREFTRADLDAMPDDGHRYELIAWDLVDGQYLQVADVSSDEPYAATEPYEVVVVPARLRD